MSIKFRSTLWQKKRRLSSTLVFVYDCIDLKVRPIEKHLVDETDLMDDVVQLTLNQIIYELTLTLAIAICNKMACLFLLILKMNRIHLILFSGILGFVLQLYLETQQ